MQEARIIAENAKEAQKELGAFSQKKLDLIIKSMSNGIKEHIEELAKLSYEETDYGNIKDKHIKNKFVCTELVDKLEEMKCVGIIKEDVNKKVIEVGVPLGVIVALCPSTNPVSTTIYKTFIAIKSANAIIFLHTLKPRIL